MSHINYNHLYYYKVPGAHLLYYYNHIDYHKVLDNHLRYHQSHLY